MPRTVTPCREAFNAADPASILAAVAYLGLRDGTILRVTTFDNHYNRIRQVS